MPAKRIRIPPIKSSPLSIATFNAPFFTLSVIIIVG